jgi:hypothetical protein
VLRDCWREKLDAKGFADASHQQLAGLIPSTLFAHRLSGVDL